MKNLRIMMCITCFIVTQGIAQYMMNHYSYSSLTMHTDGAWHQMEKYKNYQYPDNENRLIQSAPGIDLSGYPTASMDQVKLWFVNEK